MTQIRVWITIGYVLHELVRISKLSRVSGLWIDLRGTAIWLRVFCYRVYICTNGFRSRYTTVTTLTHRERSIQGKINEREGKGKLTHTPNTAHTLIHIRSHIYTERGKIAHATYTYAHTYTLTHIYTCTHFHTQHTGTQKHTHAQNTHT